MVKKTETPTEGTQETVTLAEAVAGNVMLDGVSGPFEEADWIHPLVLIQEALSAPFPQELISYRDGPWNKDTKSYDQLRYVNINHYEDRLNALAYGHWSSSKPEVQNVQQWKTPRFKDASGKWVEGEPFLDHGFVVTGTVTIHGVTHGGTSDFENTVTAGYAAYFKRACLKFGLGRELYEKETTSAPLASSQPRSSTTPTTSGGSQPSTGTSKASDGGYPRPTDGQNRFLMKLGVPQSLIDQNDGNGNYTITGNVGRAVIDRCKDGQEQVVDVLRELGINMPTTTKPTDGLPVRSGYTRR